MQDGTVKSAMVLEFEANSMLAVRTLPGNELKVATTDVTIHAPAMWLELELELSQQLAPKPPQ